MHLEEKESKVLDSPICCWLVGRLILMVIGKIRAALLIEDYGQSKRQSCGIRLDWNGLDYLSDALLCASLGCYGYVEVASIFIGWVCTVYLVVSKLLILIHQTLNSSISPPHNVA